jgi:magnesium chelatase family protein
VDHDKLFGLGPAEPSSAVRERVVKARQVQQRRFSAGRRAMSYLGGFRLRGARRPPTCNAEMRVEDLRRHCRTTPDVTDLLRSGAEAYNLTARSCHRVLKLARTIADLDGCRTIACQHVAEALQYRPHERL